MAIQKTRLAGIETIDNRKPNHPTFSRDAQRGSATAAEREARITKNLPRIPKLPAPKMLKTPGGSFDHLRKIPVFFHLS
jgi:hypothetical protein